MMIQRDLVGYGARGPRGKWPNGAQLAISICLNYEEGSERSHAMGDPDQESSTELGNYPFPAGKRDLAMESMYEYGSRVGVWRVFDVLKHAHVRATMYACAVAFEQNPDVAKRVVEDGHDVVAHGYRWEDVFRLSEEEERTRMRMAVESLTKSTGRHPSGWYCRYGPSVSTRKLVVEEGGFQFDCDAYNDDTPYYVDVNGAQHLVIPYTPDVNDFRFWSSPGIFQGEQFFQYASASFDTLYEEGVVKPRMMSIGLHPRMIGRPGRINGLKNFIEYAQKHSGVWFATRSEIAMAWQEMHPKRK
jgi:peptidoglycan/xylan/chitin deacetylase (PgdA/CDA1 family)